MASLFRSKWIRWIVVPLVVLGLTEGVAQVLVARRVQWYEQSDPKAVNFVFVGSSRVEIGFDEKSFDRRYSELSDDPVKAWNVGAGNSTAAAHALALRNFIKERGDAKGLTVFIELNSGIPSQLFAQKWTDSWVRDDAPYVLPNHLRASDVGRFLRSDTSTDNKATVLLRYAGRKSALVSFRDGFQSNFTRTGDKIARRGLEALGAAKQDTVEANTGGVNLDPLRLAQEADEQRRLARQPISVGVDDWSDQILADIVRDVDEAGGRVAFVEVPISPTARSRYSGARYDKDKAGLATAMERWNTLHIEPELVTTDSDFPDLNHLSTPAATRFSAAVAEAYLKASEKITDP